MQEECKIRVSLSLESTGDDVLFTLQADWRDSWKAVELAWHGPVTAMTSDGQWQAVSFAVVKGGQPCPHTALHSRFQKLLCRASHGAAEWSEQTATGGNLRVRRTNPAVFLSNVSGSPERNQKSGWSFPRVICYLTTPSFSSATHPWFFIQVLKKYALISFICANITVFKAHNIVAFSTLVESFIHPNFQIVLIQKGNHTSINCQPHSPLHPGPGHHSHPYVHSHLHMFPGEILITILCHFIYWTICAFIVEFRSSLHSYNMLTYMYIYKTYVIVMDM